MAEYEVKYTYEVLDGNNDVMFLGFPADVLAFLDEPANLALAFWVRRKGDDKKIKADMWLFLARIVAKSVVKMSRQK